MSEGNGKPDKKHLTGCAHIGSVAEEIAAHAKSGDLDAWVPGDNEVITQTFADSYFNGGLEEIDDLIDDINLELMEQGCMFSILPGAACQHDESGNAEALMIYYLSPEEKDTPMCKQWIRLTPSSQWEDMPVPDAMPIADDLAV